MMKYRVEIAGVELEMKKERYSQTELARMTEEKIAEINADVELYTDGSSSGRQQNGGA